MRSARLATLALFFVLACNMESLEHGRAPISGKPLKVLNYEGGKQTILYSPTHLVSRLKHAKKPIYLYAEGVHIAPGTSAEIYIVDPGVPEWKRGAIDPSNFAGSITNTSGNPMDLAVVTNEIRDFDVGGRQLRARTNLRGMGAFALALVVRSGSMTIDRFVMTTDPKPELPAAETPTGSPPPQQ